MPIMTVSKGTEEHIIPIAGWSDREVIAVALSYEASGFDVTTGKLFI